MKIQARVQTVSCQEDNNLPTNKWTIKTMNSSYQIKIN